MGLTEATWAALDAETQHELMTAWQDEVYARQLARAPSYCPEEVIAVDEEEEDEEQHDPEKKISQHFVDVEEELTLPEEEWMDTDDYT